MLPQQQRQQDSGARPRALLDRFIILAAGAYSIWRVLRWGHAPLIRVRRSSDNAEKDIYPRGMFLDVGALLEFAAGGSCFITVIYDQSGNGRDVSEGTAGKQPRIVNAGVLDRAVSNPGPRYDGSDDTLTRSDALGFSGSQDITVGWACALANAASTFAGPFTIGGTAFAGDNVGCSSNLSNTQLNMARGGPFFRTFTASDLRNPHYYVARWAAGAPVSAMDVRQDGSTLSGSTTGAAGTTSYANTAFTIGSVLDTVGTGWVQGWVDPVIVFKANLTGDQLALLERDLARSVL